MKTLIHNHIEDAFDAVPGIKAFFDRLEAIGIEAVAITGHGNLNAMCDVYAENAARGNKFNIIYGIELYVATPAFGVNRLAHMICMAKNNRGKQGIDKLLSSAKLDSKNRAYVTYDDIAKFFGKGSVYYGQAIFTTACIQGVPHLFLRENELTQHDIDKVLKRMNKDVEKGKIRESLEDYAADEEMLRSSVSELDTELERLGVIAADTGADVKKRATQARKAGATEEAEELAKKAEEKSKKSKEAKARIKTLKKSLTAQNKALKSLLESKAVAAEYDRKIKELEAGMISEENRIANAKKALAEQAELVGKNNLLVEIQYHGLKKEEYCYNKVIKIADELGMKLVAANDAHMADNSPEQLRRRQVAKFLRYGSLFDETDEDRESEKEMYLKSPDELREMLLKVYPEDAVNKAISNADVIGDYCNVTLDEDAHYPVFDKNVDANELIRKIAYEAIPKRFKEGEFTDEYKARLEKELDVICSMGYADYHLVTADFIKYGKLLGKVPPEKVEEAPLTIEECEKWVKENGYDIGLGIGPARGSAAGSLVCYLLDITNLDPIPFGLLFERFLNPERYSMPDIDIDFSPYVREQVIRYVRNKYGNGAICRIMTKGYEKAKGAIRDAARYYGAVEADDPKAYIKLGDKIRKAVPNAPDVQMSTKMGKLEKAYENTETTVYDYLVGQFKEDSDALKILEIANDIEGMFFSTGVHAAGVVIPDNDDITDYIPLRYNKDIESYTTCCTKEQVEEQGLLKFDFLGLKNLAIISDTLRDIKKHHGVSVDTDENILKTIEPAVIENIFAAGNTIGVFQFESAGMRKYLKKMHPQSLDDLVILNALYRPGPLQFIDDVCDAKNGIKSPKYLTPELEPILSVTYGAIVYQEQVMQIVQSLAGYSMGKADMIRKYMSKKNEEKLLAERKDFVSGNPERDIKGCVANGISEEIANKIFDQMVDFARYAFNKSHAAAYSTVAYITGWLKYHYPTEYFTALLNWTDKIEERLPIIKNAKEMGVHLLPPDVNRSKDKYSVSGNDILVGLGSVKGIKSNAKKIIEAAPYKDFVDFAVRSEAGSGIALTLVDCGAFDSFGIERASLAACVDDIIGTAKKIRTAKQERDGLFKAINIVDGHNFQSVDEMNGFLAENDIKLKLTGKKVPTIDDLKKKLNNKITRIEGLNAEITDYPYPKYVTDKQDKMSKEKELLGVYISGHPADDYVAGTPISDIERGNVEFVCVVTELVVRTNKAGKKWAAFTAEDSTGMIKVNVFSKGYAGCEDIIKEGNVVKVNGFANVDDFLSSDEEEVLSVSANSVTIPEKKNPNRYVLFFDSIEAYRDRKIQDELLKAKSDAPDAVFVLKCITGSNPTMDYIYSKENKIKFSVKAIEAMGAKVM